jgi:hypothetical protein
MGHLKLSAPTSARQSVLARKVAANCNVKVRANSLISKTEPSVPLTPQRLELIKACAKLYSSSVGAAKPAGKFSRATVAAFLNHRSATRTPRLRGRSTGSFVAVFLFAILPSFALGVIIWLGTTAIPSPGPLKAGASTSLTLAPLTSLSPVLSTPRRLEAAAGDTVPFPIALDGTDGVPARSLIAIRGLPVGSALSSGRPYGQTEWTLRPDEIGELHLMLPKNPTSDSLTIELIAPDGRVLTDSATLLQVNANSDANIIVHTVTTQRIDGLVTKGP